MRRPCAGLLLLALAMPACGLMDPGARARDAGQIVHAGVGVSLEPSLYLHALAPLFGTSLGYMGDTAYVGSDYGYTFGWHQAGYGMLIGGEVVRAEFGQSVQGFSKRPLHQTYAVQTQMLFLNLVVRDERIGEEARAISLRRFEANLHVLVIGLSLGLDVFETFDFVGGFFGLDLTGDDEREPRHAPFPLPEGGRSRGTLDADSADDAPSTDDVAADEPSGSALGGGA